MTLALVGLCVCAVARGDSGRDPFAEARADLEQVNLRALKMAVRDLIETFPAEYSGGDEYLNAVARFERRLSEIREGLRRRDRAAMEEAWRIVALERRALLSNPLLDFDRLLLIKRKPLDDPRRAMRAMTRVWAATSGCRSRVPGSSTR
jgi:hypothetical protein